MIFSPSKHPISKAIHCLILCSSAYACSSWAAADAETSGSAWSGWSLGYSPLTYHYSDAKQEHAWEPEEQKHSYVWLLQAEKTLDARHIAGFAVFSNSFGQPSQYGYYGWRFRPFDSTPQLFVKLTAGIIHGYKYPYDKKIPLNNRHGWGITAIPAVGYDFTPNWGGQVNVLGNAGVMFQLNYSVH
ncbi:MAG: hypothetical protein LBV14_04410 [Acidovorax sp.]|jgi:hypothetical protein|nr:hypothetical protein [Acidovorax sp.]